MVAPATTNEFLDLVRKSGVLDEKRLDAHVQKLRAVGDVPSEPGKMAGLLVRDGLLTLFQAEQICQGKWRRFTIGKYKVLERLGSGGMGSVYLCEHKLMRRRVAVKVLPTAKAADESSLQRFYREARAAAALDHPNIVHAYDIDQDDKLHFLVMEYVDGASLQELVKRGGPLEPFRAAHYIRQAALGLDHAHKAGLVHRDVKPGNILVDRTGLVKVLDMGLARFFNDEEDMLTRKFDENVLGTADYLAPEQAIDSHTADIRADIYGLGATFYFLLSGRPPFGEGTTAQKLIWHQTRQPRPLGTVRNDIPAAIAAVIEKMMAKDPNARYQTPSEVGDALAPFTQSPIGPPSDKEMPKLSLAATGVPPGGEQTQVTNPAAAAPSSGPRKSWQVTGSPAPRPPAAPAARVDTRPVAEAPTQPTRPAVQVPPAPVPAAPAPRQAAAPAPATTEEEESIPWDRVTSDTEDPSAKVDTTPRSDSRKRGSGRRSGVSLRGAPREGKRFWILTIVLSVLAIAGLVTAGFVFGLFGGRQDRAAAQRVLKVGKVGGTYTSVREALANARSGDRIVLVDGQHREQLRLQDFNGSGIRIEPVEGRGVVWLPLANRDEKTPLLQLVKVKGLHVRGIRFDGEDRVLKLVALSGHSPGLILENVGLTGFKTAGLTVTNCAGDPGRPVELLRLTATPALNEKAEAAILFNANPKMDPEQNDHIVVRDCTFGGQYAKAPVWVMKKGGPHLQFGNNTPDVKGP